MGGIHFPIRSLLSLFNFQSSRSALYVKHVAVYSETVACTPRDLDNVFNVSTFRVKHEYNIV
jgi:hypothetical protein